MNLGLVELYPGVCAFCRRAPEAPQEAFVDTHMQSKINVRSERLYICPQCGGQIALALGYVPGTDVEQAKEELEAIYDELDVLAEANANHQILFDTLAGRLNGPD